MHRLTSCALRASGASFESCDYLFPILVSPQRARCIEVQMWCRRAAVQLQQRCALTHRNLINTFWWSCDYLFHGGPSQVRGQGVRAACGWEQLAGVPRFQGLQDTLLCSPHHGSIHLWASLLGCTSPSWRMRSAHARGWEQLGATRTLKGGRPPFSVLHPMARTQRSLAQGAELPICWRHVSAACDLNMPSGGRPWGTILGF